MSKDNYNAIKPSHYKATIKGIEVEAKDVMEGFYGTSAYEGFCKGNVVKYILRADNKNGIEDLKKAEFYLKELIKIKTFTEGM